MKNAAPPSSRLLSLPTSVVMVAIVLSVGCSTPKVLSRFVEGNVDLDLHRPASPIHHEIAASSRRILARHMVSEVFDAAPARAVYELQRLVDQRHDLAYHLALADTSAAMATMLRDRGRHDEAVVYDQISICESFACLFSPEFATQRNPYDPGFRRAGDLYARSLAALLRHLQSRGQSVLDDTTVCEIRGGGPTWRVRPRLHGATKAKDLTAVEVALDYRVDGVRNRFRQHGLGVPLLAHPAPSGLDSPPWTAMLPPGICFPMTAVLRPPAVTPRAPSGDASPHEKTSSASTRDASIALDIYDALEFRRIELAGREVPLARDLTLAAVCSVSHPQLENLATRSLVNPNPFLEPPDEGRRPVMGRLLLMQPYRPDRIPVVMVHGFWSSPTTWIHVYNELVAGNDALRDRYQFYLYFYPSGQPFWVSAAQLRTALDEMRNTIDPEHRNAWNEEMVLIGHSMGGLIALMQTVETGDRLWRLVSDRPLSSLDVSDRTRETLASWFHFRPHPSVRRVVLIGTPHAGIDYVTGTSEWLASKLFSLPEDYEAQREAIKEEAPELFRAGSLLSIRGSVEALAPDSPFFTVLDDLQPASSVRYHSIVGDVPRSLWSRLLLRRRGDGILSLENAHEPRAATEIRVPAEHTVLHHHPGAILEVERVLREHAVRVAARVRASRRVGQRP